MTDFWVPPGGLKPPSGRPAGQGSTFGPDPWWQHRHPRPEGTPDGDRERLELAALKFTPSPDMERAIVIREVAPDVFEQLPRDHHLALEVYDKGRAAAIECGRAQAGLDPTLVREIQGLVGSYRAGADVADVDAESRVRFNEAVAGGDFAAVITTWGEWLAAHARREAQLAGFERAWSGLMLPPRSFDRHLAPAFLEELNKAVGGRPSSFGGTPLRDVVVDPR